MKAPIYYRKFDYDKALIPNKYLASMEQGVSTIEQAKAKTGFSVGYPGWNLIYHVLLSHLNPKEYNIIIETGTNRGFSTIMLAQALRDSACPGKVFTVELSQQHYAVALSNFRHAGVSDFIDATNAHSCDFLKDFAKTNIPVRIAFLDASHLFDDVISEFEIILPLLGPQSIVIFDNTYLIAEEHEDQRVNGALREILRRHGGNLVNFEIVSWYTPGIAIWQRYPFDSMTVSESNGKENGQEVEKINAEIRRKLELSNFAQKQQQDLNASKELLPQHCRTLNHDAVEKCGHYLQTIVGAKRMTKHLMTNVSGMKNRRRILLYTDSRGKNIRGHCDYKHYGARLAEQFDVDMYLCPEKWTTTLDFLTLCQHIRLEDYDAVILHTGIVDASPRHQRVAIEQIYSTKKAHFDELFGERRIQEYLNTDLGCEYEGDKTINLYSLDMAKHCLLPLLKRIPRLIWIGGNRIVPGWRGNYWKERPANISLVEQYFTLFASKLDHVVNLMAWNYDEVRQHTFDNMHPNKTGSDYIYERLLQQINEVSKVAQRTTASGFPCGKHSLCSQDSEHKNELISPHDRNNVGSTGRMTLEVLANKYAGRRAFIIGNGPSLNKLDMTKLKDEITFGVNNIFYNFETMGFKPTFYIVEDRLIAQDRANEINELDGVIKIFGEYTKKYKFQDKDDVIWANVIVDYEKYPDFPHFSENAATCLWVGGTVSYLCMQLAYHMGFDEVFLIGFDHNYIIPSDAAVKGCVITSASDDPNHFHPEYFGKGKRWHDPCLDRMELAYHRAKQVFEQNGRKIYNATVGGRLEIFPRVDYDRLFDRGNDCKYSSLGVTKETGSAEDAQTTISSVQGTDCEVARLKKEGTHLYGQGDLSKAAAAFHRALTLAPKDAELLGNLGLTSLKVCNLEKSPAYFKAAIRLDPENTKYWVGLAIASHHAKDRETFNLAHERIRNLDPAHFEQSELGLRSLSGSLESETHRSNEKGETACPVSVIMPSYNDAKHLGQAIKSVLAQTYRNFELVIINDGSTDNTEEIVAGFKDKSIKYFRQENQGLAAAHNAGIKQSQGEFIIKLDCDDLMTPDFITKHLQQFEKHPEADLVYCDDYLIDRNDKPIRIIKRAEYADRKLLIRDMFRSGFPVVPFRTCIRRSVFDKIGFFDENLPIGEDYDMMRRFVKHGLEICHLPSALYLRRMTENSLSRNLTAQKAKSHFELVKRFTNTFTYEELFPDVAWDEIPVDTRRLHAKCLAVVTYLAIGQDYSQSNSARIYAKTAFEQACLELRECLEMDPNNREIRDLLQKCELGRQRYEQHSYQAVC